MDSDDDEESRLIFFENEFFAMKEKENELITQLTKLKSENLELRHEANRCVRNTT